MSVQGPALHNLITGYKLITQMNQINQIKKGV